MSSSQTNTPSVVLSYLQENTTIVSVSILVLFLIIILLLIIFKVPFVNINVPTSAESITSNLLIPLFFCLLIVILCINFIPTFKGIKDLLLQIKNATYMIIYTIFLILLFALIPSNILNNYAYIITPITMLFTGYALFKSLQNNCDIKNCNANYERIKTTIAFACLITIIAIYYSIDPGGYIQKYFGYSLLLTIIISVFSLLYLIILITLPETNESSQTNASTNSSLLSKFSKFSVWGSIIFVLFLIAMTFTIIYYPGGFFNDKVSSSIILILVLIISISWLTILISNMFPEISNGAMSSSKISLYKRSLLTLFSIVISALIIVWIVYNFQNLSGQTSIISFILNLFVVLIVLGLIYKILFEKTSDNGVNSQRSGFIGLLVNMIFYIPCLFTDMFDIIINFFTGKTSANSGSPFSIFVKTQYDSTTHKSIIILFVSIILLVLYFTIPLLLNKISIQGGNLLVNEPVYLNSSYSLGSYQELNGNDNFNYKYAISFWIFLDAAPPNMSSSYSKYTSLLNFGNKPNVLYKGDTNTLIVIMANKEDKNAVNNVPKLYDLDEEGNRILYKKEKILLQTWNNIIINYNGGVLDIFLNGELVKSDIGVVPYYTLDSLTIGENNGVNGGICNVNYFDHALTYSNVYYIYNTVKNKSPPVMNQNAVTILKK